MRLWKLEFLNHSQFITLIIRYRYKLGKHLGCLVVSGIAEVLILFLGNLESPHAHIAGIAQIQEIVA